MPNPVPDETAPTFGSRLPRQAIAPVLGPRDDDIDDRYPVEEVSTGLPHLIVPLRTLDSLKRASVSKDKGEERKHI